MSIVEINSLADEGVAVYAHLTEAQLRNRLEPEKGIFIVESAKVIAVALEAGYEVVSFLTERKHLLTQALPLAQRCGDVPIYVGDRSVLSSLTGYELTRGVLCAMRRPKPLTVEEVCGEKKRVVVMDGVVNSTNTGAIFRAAAALGMEAVLLTPTCCDPLNRRAVRVSMGTVFQVPWCYIGGTPAEWYSSGIAQLQALGFRTVAMALCDNAVAIDDACLKQEDRLAVVMGTEGDGLGREVINACDYVARIPMSHGVDSLNVAAAAAVAFWELKR